MNADAARRVVLDADVGAKVGWLLGVGIGLVVVGLLHLAGGVVLIARGGAPGFESPRASVLGLEPERIVVQQVPLETRTRDLSRRGASLAAGLAMQAAGRMRLDAAVRAAAWMNALFLSPQQRRGGLASVSAGRRAGAELSKRERYARFGLSRPSRTHSKRWSVVISWMAAAGRRAGRRRCR